MTETSRQHHSSGELPVVQYFAAIDWPMMHPGRELPKDRAFSAEEIDNVLTLLKERCLSISAAPLRDEDDIRVNSSVYVRFEVDTYGHEVAKSSLWRFDTARDAGHLGYAWKHFVTPVRILKE